MTSWIDKLFHKRLSEETVPLEHEPTRGNSQPVSNEPEGIPAENTSIDSKINPHLEITQLIVGVAQSVGVQRDHNEDTLFTLTTNLVSSEKQLHFGLYIVADGMGGHENGEIASSMAVEKFTYHIIHNLFLPLFSSASNEIESSIQEVMQSGVIHAHQTIKKEAMGSGTTLTAALILGDLMTIAHVGDSRAYLILPDGNFQLLTHDHSLVKRLEEIGQITAEQVSTHPQRNVLYRALGQGESFEPDIATFQMKPGYQLLLCSDGLWGVVSEADMAKTIYSNPDPQFACQSLIDLANSAGGPDNISAIIARVPG